MINALAYESEIPKLIKHSGADVSNFIITPNIQQWCDENGVDESKKVITCKHITIVWL